MTDKSVWDKEIPVPKRLIEYIDQGVRDSKTPLPSRVTSLRDGILTIHRAPTWNQVLRHFRQWRFLLGQNREN